MSDLSFNRRAVLIGGLACAAFGRGTASAEAAPGAIAMHGEPAWGLDFTHPTYANPAAPKGASPLPVRPPLLPAPL